MVLFEVTYFSNALRSYKILIKCSHPSRKTNQIDDEDYDNYNKNGYPVIYLLHGLGNDESIWMRITSIKGMHHSMGLR